ncbi:hypothetical protein JKY72_01300 [Candidatus Gracilibacteria bacterium]|nr:hypothetical protein [Candidatus Gracilibacteria bacterium]
MNLVCTDCGEDFDFSAEDRELYDKCAPLIGGEKFEIPDPHKCESCSMRHRMIFRNERSLYYRKCSSSGDKIVSIYDDKVKFPVYESSVWFGDSWNACDYGQDFDFEKPFFEQYLELQGKVPRMALVGDFNENCHFCNTVGKSKNCYLLCGSINCEDCYYGNPFFCKKSVDSLLLRNSEITLECIDSDKLYECFYCQNCSNSQRLKFCFAVHNSQDCFACCNLSHAQYQILNKQYSKEDYEKIVGEIDVSTDAGLEAIWAKFEKLKLEVPHRSYIGTNNENVGGNYIFNSKDCYDVWGVADCRDVRHSFQLAEAKDCIGVANGEYGELLCNVMAFYKDVSRCIFSTFLWDGIDALIYSSYCNSNVRDCFGCIGLRHKQYCILNKQYSKEEYEKLVPKIIEYMRKTGEWGQFFPAEISPFAYNESIAVEYLPLLKEEVLAKGLRWKDFDGAENEGVADALKCEVTAKPFGIMTEERKFYEKCAFALPKRCPKQRHLDRLALRSAFMSLSQRKCDKCGLEMETSYSNERPEKVYCEKCYREEVY